MNLDLRLPIGLMFSLFGLILTGYGMVSDRAIYQRSLGINVNLWWGLVLLAFGLVMLAFALRKRGRQEALRGAVEVTPES
jgi:putative Mn2+ efflux pump MntP